MDDSRLTRFYMAAVTLAGFACVAVAGFTVPAGRIYLPFLILCIVTIVIGSRITVQIPRLKSHICVADAVVFLALLSYGGELAVLLAAFEALCSSLRFCTRARTVFFNIAIMSLTATAVVFALNVFGLYDPSSLHGYAGSRQNFVIALSVIAVSAFLVNTLFAAMHDSLRSGTSLVETWKNKYAWSYFSYFIGAACAGTLVRLSDNFGFATIIAVFPVIFFVFMSYRMYLTNVENSILQADQAKDYAEKLEQQAVALRESEGRFRSAFDHSPIGIAIVSPRGPWLRVNRALTDILGYSESEFLAGVFQSAIFPEDLGKTMVRIHEVAAGKAQNCQMEQRYIHKSGHTVWASWSVSAAGEGCTGQPELIFQIQDITDKKLAEQRLHHDATHDALTGLANRTHFMNRLNSALNRSRRQTDHNVSVLFIDLDHFKNVNDSLGHQVGDRLLVAIADRLRSCIRPSDTVARFGGDEFAILVEGGPDRDEVVSIAERVQQEFRTPFVLGSYEISSSASIGILRASDTHASSDDMMRDADLAMYGAKRSGKARSEIFDNNKHRAMAA